jgi:hypothetical protein
VLRVRELLRSEFSVVLVQIVFTFFRSEAILDFDPIGLHVHARVAARLVSSSEFRGMPEFISFRIAVPVYVDRSLFSVQKRFDIPDGSAEYILQSPKRPNTGRGRTVFPFSRFVVRQKVMLSTSKSGRWVQLRTFLLPRHVRLVRTRRLGVATALPSTVRRRGDRGCGCRCRVARSPTFWSRPRKVASSCQFFSTVILKRSIGGRIVFGCLRKPAVLFPLLRLHSLSPSCG